MDEGAAQKLKTSLRGELLRLGDEGYEDGRKVYNAMIDKPPALIARCTRAADGPNYERSVALKDKYGPTNLFRLNHNISPAV